MNTAGKAACGAALLMAGVVVAAVMAGGPDGAVTTYTIEARLPDDARGCARIAAGWMDRGGFAGVSVDGHRLAGASDGQAMAKACGVAGAHRIVIEERP